MSHHKRRYLMRMLQILRNVLDIGKKRIRPIISIIQLSHVNAYFPFSNCDFCVTNEKCGFCQSSDKKTGYCLPVNADHTDSLSATGYCSSSNGYDSNGTSYEWADTYCHTKWTALPIIIMVLYLACFASGIGLFQKL